MSATGLDVFDKTLQTTHIWLDELIEDEAIGPDKRLAWHALGAVLRALRDRLMLDQVALLGSQMPLLVRGAHYDQFVPARLPNRIRSLDEFLEGIGQERAMSRPVNLREATRAVFGILSRHVDRGAVAKVRDALPEEIRAIWHEDPGAPGGERRPGRSGEAQDGISQPVGEQSQKERSRGGSS